MSKISKCWVVTKPSKNSELFDILFPAEMKRMELQFKGGFSGNEIVGIFTAQSEAEKVAKMTFLRVGAISKF